jgi:hypothetical protein
MVAPSVAEVAADIAPFGPRGQTRFLVVASQLGSILNWKGMWCMDFAEMT